MTIKPVVSAQKRTVGPVDAENQEPQSHASAEQSSALSQHAVAHTHRNVVIDSHGQSPKRRGEVFEDLSRHRRSPHKSKRREHHESSQRRSEREKLSSSSSGSSGSKCSSPHGTSGSSASSGSNSPANVGGVRGKSPESLIGSIGGSGAGVGSVGGGGAVAVSVLGCSKSANSNNNSAQSNKQVTVNSCETESNVLDDTEESYSGYNSGDEHLQPKEATISADEWQRRDEQFAKCMEERGYILRSVEEDGACLFRSISLQIYGDEGMHDVIRQHSMDYIYKNREYFGQFVTEDINSYIKRKRRNDSHGNHIEIQAVSEIYGRPVEVYCYKPTPINIFNSEQLNNGYVPLRLSYQRGSHYNAIIDPYNASVGVGLGLAGYKPELQTKDAAHLSEQLEIEQTMFEDKLKTTDWEATNEAIEEQIARESYLQWCRENLQKSRTMSDGAASTSATVTSAEIPSNSKAAVSKYSKLRSATATAAAVTIAAAAADTTTFEPSSSKSTGGRGEIGAIGSSDSEAACQLLQLSMSGKTVSNHSDASAYELGFTSDDTDRSSTSSIGLAAASAAAAIDSPLSSPQLGTRSKKTKSRPGALTRAVKKRRRENAEHLQALAAAAAAVVASLGGAANKAELGENSAGATGNRSKNTNQRGSSSRSASNNGNVSAKSGLKPAQRSSSLVGANARDNGARARACTPTSDVDQQPSTSKQSGPPQRKHQSTSDDGDETPSTSASSIRSTASDEQLDPTTSAAAVSPPPTLSPLASPSPPASMMHSTLYQELLEASYAADGFGQVLSESEMLQRAIQLSTQDYIEDQKRKYLYGP